MPAETIKIEKNKLTKRHILRWALIGLFIRFIFMPFLFLGPDIFYINYFPFKAVTGGAWDPYLFLEQAFPGQAHYDYYYPPVPFIIHSIFMLPFTFFLPNLNNLFGVFGEWKFILDGSTAHFAKLLGDYDLFRTLFIFKIPYLLFDFAAGWLILKLLNSDAKKSLFAYKLWMFNPFLLHACYGLGQMDITVVFFMLAAIYCIKLDKKYLAMVLLSLGFLTKTFFLILVPLAILILGRSFRERLKLFGAFIVTACVFIVPFYLSSNVINKALLLAPSGVPLLKRALFFLGYSAIALPLFFLKKGKIELDLVISSFAASLLLFYSFYSLTTRYFVLVTPLLLYLVVKNRKLWFYIAIFSIALLELGIAATWQQGELLASLNPEFFSGLPKTDAFINLFFNLKYVHQFMYRLFVFSSVAMVIHLLAVNRKYFNFPFLGAMKNDKA
ncbi:MAG: hypothetical protein Q8L26_02480 [Candidatus Omnitrophota bacterium]|nr:hypothetical protein [Candidatus Omnitrophota bacterium]